MKDIGDKLSKLGDLLAEEFPSCGFILASIDSENGNGDIVVQGTFRGASAIDLADTIKTHVTKTVAEQTPEILAMYMMEQARKKNHGDQDHGTLELEIGGPEDDKRGGGHGGGG